MLPRARNTAGGCLTLARALWQVLWLCGPAVAARFPRGGGKLSSSSSSSRREPSGGSGCRSGAARSRTVSAASPPQPLCGAFFQPMQGIPGSPLAACGAGPGQPLPLRFPTCSSSTVDTAAPLPGRVQLHSQWECSRLCLLRANTAEAGSSQGCWLPAAVQSPQLGGAGPSCRWVLGWGGGGRRGGRRLLSPPGAPRRRAPAVPGNPRARAELGQPRVGRGFAGGAHPRGAVPARRRDRGAELSPRAGHLEPAAGGRSRSTAPGHVLCSPGEMDKQRAQPWAAAPPRPAAVLKPWSSCVSSPPASRPFPRAFCWVWEPSPGKARLHLEQSPCCERLFFCSSVLESLYCTRR